MSLIDLRYLSTKCVEVKQCYNNSMQKIGILRGGLGDEYFSSIKSGAKIMQALQNVGFEVMDMLIDKEGILHIKGIPASLDQASSQVDMIWNTLHGKIGEDGEIQRMLDELNIKYSGSGSLASAMTSNKMIAKEQARELGIKIPDAILIMPEGNDSVSEITQNIYRRMSPPWVVKPLTGGSSVNSYFAFTPLELAQFVEESISHNQAFIVEQYIYGKEAAVCVIDDFRGQDNYVLPVVEVKSPNRGILTCDIRKDEHCVVGGYFKNNEKEELSKLAVELHKRLGVNDYSQSEFIVDKYGKIWYLETDSIPHMGEENPFTKSLKSVGSTLEEFVRSVINRKQK